MSAYTERLRKTAEELAKRKWQEDMKTIPSNTEWDKLPELVTQPRIEQEISVAQFCLSLEAEAYIKGWQERISCDKSCAIRLKEQGLIPEQNMGKKLTPIQKAIERLEKQQKWYESEECEYADVQKSGRINQCTITISHLKSLLLEEKQLIEEAFDAGESQSDTRFPNHTDGEDYFINTFKTTDNEVK